MRKSRFNESQRQSILDSHLKGDKTVEALCEEYQISPATFYKWKNEVETNKNEDKKRLKELEVENLRLKKMYAELQLKHEVVSDAVEILKKMQAQRKKRT
jgi:putative transposase